MFNLKKLILASIIFATSFNAPSTLFAQNATQDLTLPDLPVFTSEKHSGWAGAESGLEIEKDEFSFLPLDSAQSYNGSPAMVVNVTGEADADGSWRALIAGNNWETYSLEPYRQNGFLEFAVKGSKGGEQFNIHLNDAYPGREPENFATTPLNINQLGGVSTEWQTYRIPLTDIVSKPGESFDYTQVSTIELSSIDQTPIQFWVANIRFSTIDAELTYPAVKVNQVGYQPDGLKQAFVSGFASTLSLQDGDPFTIKSADSGEIAFEGQLKLVASLDRYASGERVLEADFSTFQTPGEYVFSVDDGSIPDSAPFEIDSNVYGPLVTDTTRYFYLQRAGIELESAFAGEYARPSGHPQDDQAEFRSGLFPARDVSGGWYDAGDYGKYVNAGATAASDLLWAYEMFPDQFPDNHLAIPESGNGVPDILDEVRWELDWIMKMQDPTSGGFYHMVQPTEQSTPHEATGVRFIEDSVWGQGDIKPSAGTGSATAVLAHAAYLFRPIDPVYASQLQASAELGYKYLEDNIELVTPVDGPYADWDDLENRFWAANALYRLTGDEKYHAAIRAQHTFVRTTFDSKTDNGYGVQDMGMVSWLPYLFSENQDQAVRDYFEKEFTAWSDHMTDRWENSTWNHTLLDGDYYWGSNYVALTTPLILYTGHRALGNDTATAEAISQQALDYLLGSNPLSISYISGYGENATQALHSATWSHDAVENVPPGVMAGGPNQYDNPLIYTQFPGKSYIDTPSNWTMNEHTVYWNSALVFHAAMQAEEATQRVIALADESVVAPPEEQKAEETLVENIVVDAEPETIVEEVEPEIVSVVIDEPVVTEEKIEPVEETVIEEAAVEETQKQNVFWNNTAIILMVAGSAAGLVLTLLLVLVGFAIRQNNSKPNRS